MLGRGINTRPNGRRLEPRAMLVKRHQTVLSKDRPNPRPVGRNAGDLRFEILKRSFRPLLKSSPSLAEVRFEPPAREPGALQARYDRKAPHREPPVENNRSADFEKGSTKVVAALLSHALLPCRINAQFLKPSIFLRINVQEAFLGFEPSPKRGFSRRRESREVQELHRHLPRPNGRRVSGERRAEGDERVRCTRMLSGSFLLAMTSFIVLLLDAGSRHNL